VVMVEYMVLLVVELPMVVIWASMGSLINIESLFSFISLIFRRDFSVTGGRTGYKDLVRGTREETKILKKRSKL